MEYISEQPVQAATAAHQQQPSYAQPLNDMFATTGATNTNNNSRRRSPPPTSSSGRRRRSASVPSSDSSPERSFTDSPSDCARNRSYAKRRRSRDHNARRSPSPAAFRGGGSGSGSRSSPQRSRATTSGRRRRSRSNSNERGNSRRRSNWSRSPTPPPTTATRRLGPRSPPMPPPPPQQQSFSASMRSYDAVSEQQPQPPGEEDARPLPKPQQPLKQPSKTSSGEDEHAKREANIAREKDNQMATLRKQHDEYVQRTDALHKELNTLRIQHKAMLAKPSGASEFLAQNMRLQSQCESKIATLKNVVDMLKGILRTNGKLRPDDRRSSDSEQRAARLDAGPVGVPGVDGAAEGDDDDERLKREALQSLRRKKADRIDAGANEAPPAIHNVNPSPPKELFNYVHYDPEIHWCRTCQIFPKTAKDFLTHLHTKEHQDQQKIIESPWHDRPSNDEIPQHPGAPTKRTPIRGLQFFVPATGWYCRLCDVWMGDLHCASLHLKSKTHAHQYLQFMLKNPGFESNWMVERQRSYEAKHQVSAAADEFVSGAGIPLQIPAIGGAVVAKSLDANTALAAVAAAAELAAQKKAAIRRKRDERKKRKRSVRKHRKNQSSSSSSSSSSGSSSGSSSSTSTSSDSESDVSSSEAARKSAAADGAKIDILQQSFGSNPTQGIRFAVRKVPPTAEPVQVARAGPAPVSLVFGANGNARQPAPSQPMASTANVWDNDDDTVEEPKAAAAAPAQPPAASLKSGADKATTPDAGAVRDLVDTRRRSRTPRSRRRRYESSRSPSRDRYRRSRSRTDRRRRASSRDRRRTSRDRHGGGSRRGRRSRSRSPSRRHRVSRSPRGYGRNARRTRSPSPYIEKPVVTFPEFRPRVPEPGPVEKDAKKEKRNQLKKAASTAAAAAATAANGVTKKLPFIGRMPVFKKQTNADDELRRDDSSSSATSQQQQLEQQQYQQYQQQYYGQYYNYGEILQQPPPGPPAEGAEYEQLMPDPMQFVLGAVPPPPPMVPPPASPSTADNAEADAETDAAASEPTEPVLPPGIDDASADVMLQPIVSDAPMPRRGPLPQDFQDALSIIFPTAEQQKLAAESEAAAAAASAAAEKAAASAAMTRQLMAEPYGDHLMSADGDGPLGVPKPVTRHEIPSEATISAPPVSAAEAHEAAEAAAAAARRNNDDSPQNSVFNALTFVNGVAMLKPEFLGGVAAPPTALAVQTEAAVDPPSAAAVDGGGNLYDPTEESSGDGDDEPVEAAVVSAAAAEEAISAARQEELDDLAMLGIDANDLAAQYI